MVLLSLALSVTAVGCTTVAYTPTQASVPKISYAAADKNLLVLKGSQIYTGKRFFEIADVKTGPETVEILFKPQNVLGGGAGGTDKYTIHLRSLDVPPVMTRQGGDVYSMIFADGWVLVFRTQQDAITLANALFILARRADGYTPPEDAAAEAALRGEARSSKDEETRRTSVAVPESRATIPVATVMNVAGRFKAVEVMHFSQVEGLGLSQAFVNAFYGSFRETLAKMSVAEQVVGEGVTVLDTDAAHSIVVEGKFTEFLAGGFLAGAGVVGSEITLSRKSDHAPITTVTPRVAFKPSPLNTDTGVGKMTGQRTALQLRDALK